MPFITQGKTNLRYILIIVVLATIVGGGILSYYYSWIKELETKLTEMELRLPEVKPSEDETANRKTFRGEISSFPAGEKHTFEFSAPAEFTEIIPYPWINPESYKYYYGAEGQSISFFAGLMEGPGILTTLYGHAKEADLCPEPLKVSESEVVRGNFEACDILQIDGRNFLFLIKVYLETGHATTCEPKASVYIVYNLDTNGSVLFTLSDLDVLREIIEPWGEIPADYSYIDEEGSLWTCPPDLDHGKVKENFSSRIMDIRNAENLSSLDTEKLKTLYQILSTFKFLE